MLAETTEAVSEVIIVIYSSRQSSDFYNIYVCVCVCAYGGMVIIVGNGHDDLSSDPGGHCLHFT